MDSENNRTDENLILVIDDEDMLRDVLKELLDMVGLSAFFASSGPEGIEIFKSHRDRIRLILIDVLMPEMSGIETYKEIISVEPDMKFIFMSGFPDKDALAIQELPGDIAFIKKPFSVQQIINQIKQMLP
jgi:DNA-binding NtrC family response regulator